MIIWPQPKGLLLGSNLQMASKNYQLDDFWKIANRHDQPGDHDNSLLLTDIAESWLQRNNHFGAGYTSERAMKGFWGDPERMYSCWVTSLRDYETFVANQATDSIQSLAGLAKLTSLLHRMSWTFDVNTSSKFRTKSNEFRDDLAHRLVTFFGNHPCSDSYLVKGVIVKTDLGAFWDVEYPEFEVDSSLEAFGNGILNLSIPSAFELYVRLTNYQGAQAIIDRCPKAFTTPGLRGWKSAVQGFLHPLKSPEYFFEAAEAFAQDVAPSRGELKNRQSWRSENRDLWSKYFRSRSSLASAVREPNRVRHFISEAALAVDGTEFGWHSGEVSRYRILVQTLAHLIGEQPAIEPQEARRQFEKEIQITGKEKYDSVANQLFAVAADSFKNFQQNPEVEFTSGRLRVALDSLARIPLIGPEVADAIEPEVALQAQRLFNGPVRTRIYRTLENIKDEKQLQRIILRLLQSSIPLYAQVLHGPWEYGKDIVVAQKEGDSVVLKMYQVKCGDITQPGWRSYRAQLEEMFLVPLSTLQISSDVDRREGILICNGHALPGATPVIEAWFKQQADEHDRQFSLVHIDCLVTWIVSKRLYNEFQLVLSELGIDAVR